MPFIDIVIYVPIFIWLAFSIYCVSPLAKETRERFLHSIPSGFTTTGVLGTFLGIYFGLRDFDVNAIQESIPLLLEGLKSAFLTSILGIVLSMISQKIIEYFFYDSGSFDSDETQQLKEIKILLSETSNQNDLKGVLEQIYQETKDTVGTELSKLNLSANRVESAIAEQTSRINQNNTENNRALVESMETSNQKLFEKMAEMNSKELLNAMEESVKIFNDKMEDILSKLVKENFDALNKSVNQLNDWQEQHKSNVDNLVKTLGGLIDKNNEMIKIMESTSSLVETNLTKASNKMVDVAATTGKLTEENGRLQNLIKELEKVFIEENQITKLIDNANQSVEKMNIATNNFTDGMDKVSDIQNQIFRTSESMTVVHSELQKIADFKNVNGAYWEDVKLKLNEGVSILNNASKRFGEDLENIDETFKSNLDETFSSLDKLIQHYIVKTEY